MKNNWKYTVENSAKGWLIELPGALLLGGIAAWMYTINIIACFFLAFMAALLLSSVIYEFYCNLFKKIFIDEKGFYYQTSPKKRKYFSFADISKAWIGGAQNYSSDDYFCFQTLKGDIYKFNLGFVDNGDGVFYMLKEINGEEWSEEDDDE